MIHISFYLLTPSANNLSNLYVSISLNKSRLRFATGKRFLTCYCNVRKTKGSKDLLKRNSPLFMEYRSCLEGIRDQLLKIELTWNSSTPISLIGIKQIYYDQIGIESNTGSESFESTFNKFISETQSAWTAGTSNHYITLKNHLMEYQKKIGKIDLERMDPNFWYSIRDNYFVSDKAFSNSTTNANLKKLKQFIKYAYKNKLIKKQYDLEDFTSLEEIEPYKIALSESEVLDLLALKLEHNKRLELVKDLFLLEILTGQRFSDIPKLVDPKNISTTAIQIYQQKTGEKVFIPLHPKLKKHLQYIIKKYPIGIPTISNQKFNDYLKEICQLAKFDRQHSWVKLVGKNKITISDHRYNLISSHTGRRTFCSLALKSGIQPEIIMKVSGHKTYAQFKEYVKVDDADLDNAFDSMFKLN